MKTKLWKFLITLMVILPLALVSCHDDYMIGIRGQGEIEEETISVDDFDGFLSAISADIFLKQGDRQEVVIEAQQNIIDNIDLDRIDNGIWTIRYHQMVRYAKPVKIYITIPTLTKAGISGSGEITGLTPFTGLDRLRLLVSGSGSIDLETESTEVDAAISGSGDLRMAGKTGEFSLLVSGSGSFHGSDLVTTSADLTLSGSGSARLTVEEFLHVMVSGSGYVYYYGDPDVDAHVSGSGRVIRGQ